MGKVIRTVCTIYAIKLDISMHLYLYLNIGFLKPSKKITLEYGRAGHPVLLDNGDQTDF